MPGGGRLGETRSLGSSKQQTNKAFSKALTSGNKSSSTHWFFGVFDGLVNCTLRKKGYDGYESSYFVAFGQERNPPVSMLVSYFKKNYTV